MSIGMSSDTNAVNCLNSAVAENTKTETLDQKKRKLTLSLGVSLSPASEISSISSSDSTSLLQQYMLNNNNNNNNNNQDGLTTSNGNKNSTATNVDLSLTNLNKRHKSYYLQEINLPIFNNSMTV